MSSGIDVTDFDDTRIQNSTVGSPASNTIHLNELDERDATLIRKTQAQLHSLTPEVPGSFDKSLIGRVAPISPTTLETQNAHLENLYTRLEENQEQIQSASIATPFPNLAWEAVKAGLEKENITNVQLNKHIQETERHQKNIDLLLDFSAELTSYKEGTEMPEKMKSLLSELKERKIDLLKTDEKALSKEKLSELKSLTSAQVDQSRSNLQIIFTTKIQTLVQSIGAIMETLKDIIRNNTRLISTANRLPGH